MMVCLWIDAGSRCCQSFGVLSAGADASERLVCTQVKNKKKVVVGECIMGSKSCILVVVLEGVRS